MERYVYSATREYDNKGNLDENHIRTYSLRKENVSLETHHKFKTDAIDRLQMLANTCLPLVGYYSNLDAGTAKAKTYFLLAQRGMKWYFHLALQPENSTHEVILSKDWRFTITAYPTEDFVSAVSWTETLMQAIIARDNEAIEWLLRFLEDRMRASSAYGRS